VNEQALLLGRSEPVVAIVTQPPTPDPDRPAIILSNSGIVHRVGPSRLYVRVARRLAARGFVVVRLDHRGIGDSDPRSDTKRFFEGAIEEIREAMDDLEAARGIRAFVIMGICSGADVAFEMAGRDDRVVGVGLLNGGGLVGHPEWTRYLQGRVYAKRYLGESIYRSNRWVRALTGRIQYRALLAALLGKTRNVVKGAPTGIERQARALAERFQGLVDRGGRVLMIHSGDDPSIEFRDVVLGGRLPTLEATGRFRDETIPGADHTFTLLEKQEAVLGIITTWASTSWSQNATDDDSS
jgi:pimeloyl-ACP methyl ester carboxylesterase